MRVLILTVAATFASCSALAEEATDRRWPMEVMPFAGYVFGGTFEDAVTGEKVDLDDSGSFGISLRIRPEYSKEWEIFYSRQGTKVQAAGGTGGTPAVDVDIEYLQFGGTYFPSEYAYAPYVLGGLGATRFSPSGGGLDDSTAFSLSLGLGIRFPLTDYFAIRLEGRGFVTFVDTDTAFFCATGAEGGVCAIQAEGSSFFQFEGLLGFAFTF